MKKIVFLGNPNVGKSALINAMSNSKIKVGNWPGVTVEKIEAHVINNDVELSFLDLPGIYNFNYSAEEKITTMHLLDGDYDLIVNVVDTTNLERNLNLTLLARELEKPMIVLLNFDDDVTKNGLVVDTKKLSKYLQMPVFKTSATKKTGIKEVLDYMSLTDFAKRKQYNIYYETKIDEVVAQIYNILINSDIKEPSYGYKYLAYRLFEYNPHFTHDVSADILHTISHIIDDSGVEDKQIDEQGIERKQATYSLLQVKRYEQITSVLSSVIDKYGVSRYKLTKKIDSIVLNKWLGIPLFLLFSVYFLSLIFNVANPLIDWIDGFVSNYLSYHASNLLNGTPDWFKSMMIDGILAGVGGVLTFTPLMYFIYLMMGILEESGIMSRIAFLMDRVMRGIGLNGKSFIAMIIGFGCTVPAITATRTLESQKARKATAMMLPFISCGARLPVYALFGAAFFSKSFGLVVASLYIIGILVAIIIGLIMKALNVFDDGQEEEAFTIELPPYRIPERKILFKNVNNRLKGFIKRVTSVIMIVLFAIWALNYFPNGRAEDSFLTKTTEFVQPIFAPTGFGESKIAIAAIPTSIAAKEAVVGAIQGLQGTEEKNETGVPEEASLAFQGRNLFDSITSSAKSLVTLNISALFQADPDEAGDATISATQQMFTGKDAPLKAYSYMVFILLLLPCAVAIATIRKEFGSRFMWQVVAVTLVVPYIGSTLIYQVGRLFLFK